MKNFKNIFIGITLGLVIFIGGYVTKTATALEGMSIFGQAIEGPEFVKLTLNNYPVFFHKNEVTVIQRDPSNGEYQMFLKSGKMYKITAQVFELLTQQIDYDVAKT